MNAKKRKLLDQGRGDDGDSVVGKNIPIRTLYVAPVNADVSNFFYSTVFWNDLSIFLPLNRHQNRAG